MQLQNIFAAKYIFLKKEDFLKIISFFLMFSQQLAQQKLRNSVRLMIEAVDTVASSSEQFIHDSV